MKEQKQNFAQVFIAAIIGSLLLFFVGYKANITSFTHDESFTYLNFVHQSFIDIISFQKANTNHHILNTLLMKYSEILFGSSELALRLPSLFSFIVYLIFSFLILKNHAKQIIIPAFILMTFNPFLLDFFGLARGYGLSIGFMIFSFFYLLTYFEKKKNSALILFHFGAFMAVLANFTMLNFYVAALIAFNLLLFFEVKSNNSTLTFTLLIKNNKLNIIALLVSAVILFEPVRKLGKYLTLDFGGKNGISDTLSSQVYNAFYNTPTSNNLKHFFVILIVAILLLNLIIILINLFKPNKNFFTENKGLIAVNTISTVILAAIIVQHFLFGYDYLKDRFALFLYPLIILNFLFLYQYVILLFKQKLFIILIYVLIPFFIFNLIRNLNFEMYKDWKYEKDTKQMLSVLEEIKEPDKTIKLGVNWVFEPTINFYRKTKNLDWLLPVTREGISETDDYIYIMKDDLVKNKKIIFSPPEGKGILYKN